MSDDASTAKSGGIEVHVRDVGSRRELRQLFRRGRVSLAIGLPFLAALIIAGEMVQAMAVLPLAGVLRESLVIGGWVAMWRPLEIFLYDWWPIRDAARLFERLGTTTVRVLPTHASTASSPR